ncbi:2-hydroxycyclohexanecarboxyl-CoA dehydrogenase [Amycolatopsis mediterranei S699]|uniref:2-hydroxycyclohexanecarboxyl-CoA dehydrogenase n=2 Tax=Amycolatopsis mediterranei TaxID=33910 RepID=A0A0H3D3S4_AMYMU|nr:3-oxoacyl-ACP reductase FabG [Amycolatopsis mediterranei]ADJ45640.1 2-hydroxycyclohexanecarboxyl-CoA dehydrogenase [Amycolatopsis mediterranei U32]AEK42419.1 2-hydroxycyclohexanecarboxyl-CoA dehydrogenase [Amycolatopsis mediterranei S699]AFO77352.1 2-hydroxycyclohexanecarboxyl-CoA dehydrogenase [Amycolatopsis mediterranei S699]AGT84480.1 2-hydroxycyclohexanecarboxyl-CoA dehydrogenase [Amycolatopsis mediterranei RB]KDO05896.1 2-hydroxycyclohexanecarboxyl-CoA dehydrogenase [Amycolatopsis medi
MDATDPVALVTGAGRGIGAAIAAELAARGHRIAVCDLDRAAAADVAADITERHGVKTAAVVADIADSAAVRAAVTEAEAALGPVDVLVNNAAIDVIGRFVDSTEDSWDRIIAVNLRGTITVTRAVLDGMIERDRGRIVHIASDAGRVGSSGEVVYSATKGGIIAFGKALAREVARHGITVNSVCPGPTDTALLGQVADYSRRMYEATLRAIPLRRVGQPADIAGVVGFLASDAAAYLTGQTISVSGGLTML